MTDLRETGSAWLRSFRKSWQTRTVSYTRGTGSAAVTADVDAKIGRTIFEVNDADGYPMRIESRDYLIEVADLEAFGEPERGDRIGDTLDGNVELFEVLAPDGEDHFRFSDPYRKVFRIHTKHVGREE